MLKSIIACVLLSLTTLAQSTDNAVVIYALSQADNCRLADGYVCAPITASPLASEDSKISAYYLSYWPQAVAAFQSIDELTDTQKQLKHYRVSFAETEQSILVDFTALLLPTLEAGVAIGFSTGRIGVPLRLTLNKKDGLVSAVHYFK